MNKIYHIRIEGKNEEQMRELFEEIQNRYGLYDNCVLDEVPEENSIIEGKAEETGILDV